MIHREFLHQRRIETVQDTAAEDMPGEVSVRGHLCTGSSGGSSFGPLEQVRDSHRQCRQVVEKESVEMIGIEHDQHIRLGTHQLLAHLGEQSRRFPIPILHD